MAKDSDSFGLKMYIFALILAAVAFLGVSIAKEDEWKAVANPPLVHAYIQTEGKTQYEIIGDLDSMRFFNDGTRVILCFHSSDIAGLPELGPSDQIFQDGFDRDPA